MQADKGAEPSDELIFAERAINTISDNELESGSKVGNAYSGLSENIKFENLSRPI